MLMDLGAIYRFRFKEVDPDARRVVWEEITRYLEKRFGVPQRLLDVACGSGEFLNASQALERWGLDAIEHAQLASDIRFLEGNYLDLQLPTHYFNMIVMSNILEHLGTRDAVFAFLDRAMEHLAPGGLLLIMGPNFKYSMKEYFDFADHNLILTDLSVGECLVGAGYELEAHIARFLPYSFRSKKGKIPGARYLTRLYLRIPLSWRFLGRQFLMVGRKPG
jgi:SAM-dependent methyltransferase